MIREEAVVVLRLDPGSTPQASAQVTQAFRTIAETGQASARQTAAAMRQLPAQFTDVATQLAGGANPLLVLLQQGGQIKDSFGGVGAAIRGIGAAITPVSAAVAGAAAIIGTFGVAAFQGWRQSAQLRDVVALTGNAAGLTADNLQRLTERVSQYSEQTVGGAREIAIALASSGRSSAEVLEGQARAVARLADLTGEGGGKIAAQFKSQLAEPARFAAQLNEQYNFLNVAQFKRIQQLEQEGRRAEAVNLTNQLLTQQLESQRQNLGTLERAWGDLRKTASEAWDAILGVGRQQTVQQQLDAATLRLRQLVDARNGAPANITDLFSSKSSLQEQIDLQVRIINGLTLQKQLTEQVAAAQSKAAAKTQTEIKDLLGSGGKKGERSTLFDGQVQAYEAMLKEWAKDPLGEFIGERVLPAVAERDQRRLEQAEAFLQELRDANERAGAQLIADEEQRGRALIELDRQIALRRLRAMGLGSAAQEGAESLINRQASLAIDKLSDKAGDAMYGDVRNALAAAFRDTRNPVKAFANALSEAVYTRMTASLADAMATALVGRSGSGGMLGQLLGMAAGVFGGGMTVDTGGIGITPADGSIPLPTRGGMASGTNYVPRDMLLLAHRGEAIVPAKYNPAAGGMGGGQKVEMHFHVGPGQSPAAFAGAVAQAMPAIEARIAAGLARPGRLLNNAARDARS